MKGWHVVRMALLLLALGAAIYVGYITDPQLPGILEGIGLTDTVLHGLGFAIIAFLALVGSRRIGILLILLLLFAGLLELSQLQQTGRSAGFDDFLANLTGTLIGWLAAIVVTWIAKTSINLRTNSE